MLLGIRKQKKSRPHQAADFFVGVATTVATSSLSAQAPCSKQVAGSSPTAPDARIILPLLLI
jgi:hypothetical protein